MFGIEWMKTAAMLLLPLLRGSAAVLCETGNTISLPCNELKGNQENCNATTWFFKSSRKSNEVQLVALGQIVSTEVELNKVHRLHLLENCSLEIKNVAVEDAGVYHCKQYQSTRYPVELAVISMTEMVFEDTAKLNCTVTTYERCKFSVYFMFRVGDHEKIAPHKSPGLSCSTSETFAIYQTEFKERSTSSWCIVKDNVEHKFPFRPWLSERNSATTTQSTTVPNIPPTDLKDWWWVFVIATVLLAAACTLTCVTVLWCRRNKGRKTHATENAVQKDGVFYTSVKFTGIRKGKIQDENDKSQFETVTYATVKASSRDPSHI